MKTFRYYAACLLAIIALAGCDKKELYTPEVLYTAPTLLKADWAGASPTADALRWHVRGVAGASASAGAADIAAAGGAAADTLFTSAPDATVSLALLEADYEVTAMHDAAHVSFDGECFLLEADAEGLLAEPGELRAGMGTFRAVAQQQNTYALPMLPFTRVLTLRFRLNAEAEGRVASISARLGGVASARRLADRATAMTPGGVVAIDIVRESTRASDAASIFFRGTCRLLGIHTGERQLLTLILHYTNGEQEALQQDLSPYLTTFNDPASDPITLTAGLSFAGQPGVSATIDDWRPGTDADLDASDGVGEEDYSDLYYSQQEQRR